MTKNHLVNWNLLFRSPTNDNGQLKSSDSDEKASTRKTSAATSSSSSTQQKPAAIEDIGYKISLDIVDEEIMKNEDPMSNMRADKELASPPKEKEKLSRKHSSGEKKHKKDKKRKHKKDKKRKKGNFIEIELD